LINKILEIFKRDHSKLQIKSGILDYTFFRDDFRRSEKTLSASSSKIDFSIENKNVVLIDDVLFTGRSIKAAMSSIDTYGRPKSIELLVLIDRRFSRHLPIQPNYKGRQVDAINEEKVIVHWKELHSKDAIYIDNK
jgi:pyrimidine operon attenuation protein/uracil phosphoribosyltransferase